MFLFLIMINAGRDNAEKQRQLEERKINNQPDSLANQEDEFRCSIHNIVDRHKQIINESVEIIRRSKNLDTIETRINAVRDSWNYLISFTIPNQPNFLKEFEQEYNQQIARAVNELYNDYILKIESLKTARAKENNTVRMLETIEKAKSILIDNETYQHSLQRLEEIHHDTEETFSSIST